MPRFNLDDYETVKERTIRFYEKYPKGAIIAELVNLETLQTHAVFKASVYEEKGHISDGTPRGVGYALEIRDLKKSVSNQGKEYESVNYTSWTENAEESAVGRALDNAGFASGTGPSREEMEKVGRMSKTISNNVTRSEAAQGPVNTGTEPTSKQWQTFSAIITKQGWDKEEIKKEFLVTDSITRVEMSNVIRKLMERANQGGGSK